MNASAILQAPRLIRLREVLPRVGVGKSTLYRMIQEGTFPAPRKIGASVSVWSDAEVSEWVEKKLAA